MGTRVRPHTHTHTYTLIERKLDKNVIATCQKRIRMKTSCGNFLCKLIDQNCFFFPYQKKDDVEFSYS